MTPVSPPVGRTVRGQVLLSDGSPSAGAAIVCQRDGSLEIVAETQSDKKGNYAIDFKQGPDELTLFASFEGHGTEWWKIPNEDIDLYHDFALTQGGMIEGQVVDMEDRPVHDVHVHLLTFDQGTERFLPHGQAFEAANSNGRFRFTDLKDETYTLKVTGTRMHVDLTEVRPGDSPTLVLGERGSIKGRVVDSSGNPVPSFQIRLYIDRDIPDYHREIYGEWFQNEEGSFESCYLRRNLIYAIVVLAEGYAPKKVENLQPQSYESDPQLIVRLDPGFALNGQVIDATTQAPIPGAYVFHLPGDEELDESKWNDLIAIYKQFNDLQREISNTDGEFGFTVGDGGSLFVKALGYYPRQFEVEDLAGVQLIGLQPLN